MASLSDVEVAGGIESGKNKEGRQGITTTKVVILACGWDNPRAGRGNQIKPMRRVLGLPLLERLVLLCKSAGFSEFLVVMGHKKKTTTSFLMRLARKRSVNIEMVENPDWRKGCGTSVLACCEKLDEPFILIMGGHLFDPELLEGLLQVEPEKDSCFLAIDRRVEQTHDLRDTMRVATQSDCITRIGNNLEDYDGIDTGIFLFTPAIFPALARAQAKDRYTLADGIAELAAEGRMRAYDIGERFWSHVDSLSLKAAERWLLEQIEKPQEEDLVAHYLIRPVSAPFSQLLAHIPIHPNIFTLISFAFALGGAYLFTLQAYLSLLLGGVLVLAALVIDCCDGEIARLKGIDTPFGAWLDTILDRYADLAIVVGITYGFWLTHPQFWVWLVGIGTLSGFLLTSYAKKEYQIRFQRPFPLWFLPRLTRRGARLFIISLGGFLGQPFFVMLGVGAISHIAVFWTLACSRKR